MLSGNASQRTPSQAIPAQSDRTTDFRAAGNRERVAKPIRIRTNVTPFGPMARIPSAINRKDAPQINPGTINSIQSPVPAWDAGPGPGNLDLSAMLTPDDTIRKILEHPDSGK